jgi:putative sterol carrier protein
MATTARKAPSKGRPDLTKAFFEDLESRGQDPLLKSTSGTLRFDLTNGRRVEHWFVALDKGQVDVSHDAGSADVVLHADKEIFDELVTGRANATAAILRGVLGLEGSIELAIRFQRLFPGPPRRRPRTRGATS